MQHVRVSWLRKFNYGLVGVTAILFVCYFLFSFLNVSQATKDRWGITHTVLAMGSIHALYVIISDKIILKRQPWLTTVASAAIYAFLFGAIIESSGNTNIVYRGCYIVMVFFMGMLGLYPPLTTTIFTWLILILTITGIATPTNASLTFNLTVDSLLTVSGLLGWFYFKRFYVTGKRETFLQSQLQEEQFKSSVILESITDGVMIINTSGTAEIMNHSLTNMLGWEQKDAKHLDYRSLIEPVEQGDATPQDAISACFDMGKPIQRVSLLKTHHNRQLYVDIVASPILQKIPVGLKNSREPADNIVGVVAVLRDVDTQKRAEQQRSDFISTASHEMRTPLAAIQGFIDLALNNKVAVIDDKAREYLTKANEAAINLGALFQDLLTSSASEDGRLVSNPVLLDVRECLISAVEQFKPEATKKSLRLTMVQPQTNGASVEPVMFVYVDRERLNEVIGNLLENAIKYTQQGTVAVSANIQKNTVVIRVADTGIGIATEDIPHLFQKFYRTDNSATREVGGTGLGLYIAKQIVELMGGRIWVESSLGVGSTFYVQIPRLAQTEVDRILAQHPEMAPKPSKKGTAQPIDPSLEELKRLL